MKTYRIKKGAHRSGLRFWPLFLTNKMSVQVIFHADCLYVQEPRQGINKLFGFSKGINHMENSMRYGWTSDGTKIFIHTFDHIDGDMVYKDAGVVMPGEPFTLTLNDPKPSFFGYRLYPYFGGDKTAPQDMTIQMEWL